MSTIHLHQTTTSTAEQYLAGLTDFGHGRSKLFGNSADDYLKVHSRRNLTGWLLGLVVRTIGKGVLEKAFVNSVKAIEARKEVARGARVS